MYPNLNAEMARHNFSVSDLCKVLGKCEKTIRSKVRGDTPITLCEARKIVMELFPEVTIDYLFADS